MTSRKAVASFCSNLTIVYFIYPETANVRLEDMNLLFGDATSQMPTPASRAEGSSLVGQQSPVPSLHLGQHGADGAIPGLDIDPPSVGAESAKPASVQPALEKKEGVGGWISSIVKRGRKGHSTGASGNYAVVGQDDD